MKGKAAEETRAGSDLLTGDVQESRVWLVMGRVGCGCTLIDAHEGQETLWTGWGGAKSWALAVSWQVLLTRDDYQRSLIETRQRVAVSKVMFYICLFVPLLWTRLAMDTFATCMWEPLGRAGSHCSGDPLSCPQDCVR